MSIAVTANIVRVLSAGPTRVRDVLRPLPLMAGIAPYPDGWRARVPPSATLPRFPMVLHRGGYPDGS